MASLNIYRACSSAEVLQTSRGRKFAHRASILKLGTWNVRSMVDTEGSIEVASQRTGGQRGEERKVDQIVCELERYDVTVGALQETRWFGSEVYEVGESVLLTSGRPTPATGEMVQRGEGVALVLRGSALSAWKRGGKQWKAWSSRCVSACLGKLHVMSCYAPTRAASREDKEAFFQLLENFITSVPSKESYVVIGDFNARVGSREDDDMWAAVRGPHGLGMVNDAGRELLSFLSSHQATICNTWFSKKNIHKQTWQHPKSKQWSCIDFVVVRQSDRKLCLDVTVRRGAVCNTDHQLVVAKMKLWRFGKIRSKAKVSGIRRYDVGKLLSKENEGQEVRDKYQEVVLERASESWPEDGDVMAKWEAVRSAMTSAADDVLGTTARRQPDWFQESMSQLRPLLKQRNEAYSRWLGSGNQVDLIKFREARGIARRAVRNAKNAWFLEKAEEVERERFGGKHVWRCIRAMQRNRRGLLPSRVVTIHDADGVPCVSTTAQHQRWRQHFTKVLNIMSDFKESELDLVRQRKVDDDIASEPSASEVKTALNKLKNGKAAGSSGIFPEMLKVGRKCNDFVDMLKDLLQNVWTERRVPQEWVDAILVPIPKKGNLTLCDNWRGIALLDVVGKLVARIVQNRLQIVSERELPESQCGFRRGRGCTDMIFVVRQLTEKTVEHQAKQFFVFVDLRKAYDSVPREAMWLVLKKLGVPEVVVEIIKSFHNDMKAKVRLDGELLEEIEVTNGLRQGCTMAPSLFNLYACAVAERWTERVKDVEGVGTEILYKLDQHLFRRSTRKASRTHLLKGEFADDVVLMARSREAAAVALQTYVDVARDFGMTVSIQKTKFMVVGSGVTEIERAPIVVDGGKIEWVSEFPYLGSLIADSGRMDIDVEKRLASASKAFGALRQAVFKDAHLSVITKRHIYRACVLSVLLYGSECWIPLRKHLQKLNSFHHRCVRTVLGITNRQQWEQRISSATVRETWGDVETITTKVMRRRLEWLGHLARMPDHRLPKICLFSWLPQTRPPGGPRRRWRDLARIDLKAVGLNDDVWYDAALDRKHWREVWSQDMGQYEQNQQRQSGGERQVVCSLCGRIFKRRSDKARHKCRVERAKPVREQVGAVQCKRCERWFRSKGGLAVHACRRDEEHGGEQPSGTIVTDDGVKCIVCDRVFRRPGDLKRHKCLQERQKPVRDQQGAAQCTICERWFKSAGGLAVHLRVHKSRPS